MARGQTNRGAERAAEAAPERQRLDLWLWHARVVRTRTLAQELSESGHVRINGQRVRQSGKFIKAGDVLTVALDSRVLVLKIVGFAEQRGRYEDARQLYEDVAGATEGRPE